MKGPNFSRGGGDRTFIDHLEILRYRIIAALIVFLLLTIVSFIFVDEITALIRRPVDPLDLDFIYIRPQEKFVTYLKVAVFTGLTASLPPALILLSSFVFPALQQNERRSFIAAIFMIVLLFILGLLFAYFILLPFAMNFFVNFAKEDGVIPMWSIGEFYSVIITVLFGCALLFQAPTLLLFLMRIEVLQPKTLATYRRHAVVLIFLTAAFLTPPDIFTQILVGVVLYLLYEATVAAGRLLLRRKRRSISLEADEEEEWTEESS
jgi:sec-independent protein translocase protein TatC